MYIKSKCLDDLLRQIYEKLLKSNTIKTSRGKTVERPGVLLEMTDPRARLSKTELKGTIFSCLGELFWYLSKTNTLNHITYYIPIYKKFSDDNLTIYGGYGPRLFNMHDKYNQIINIINLLKERPWSRRAVIQLFDASDLEEYHKDIPCTCTLQFIIRESRLFMFTNMRSNDAFIGLPHDIFVFTMIQEMIARSLKIELGTYKHFIGSLHLYESNINSVKRYLDEGWQSTTISMPAMPQSDPWESISKLIEIETKIRNGKNFNFSKLKFDEYWLDLIRLLLIFKLSKKHGNKTKIQRIEDTMASNIYKPYIQKRHAYASNIEATKQLDLHLKKEKN